MRACVQSAVETRPASVGGGWEGRARRRVKECCTGSCFFFYIPHSEFDIYYHYFCRLYNSGTLPFQSARVEQRSFGVVRVRVRASPARYKCSRFRAQFEYYIKYIDAIYYTVRTLHNARDYTTAVIILLYNILCVIYAV